MTNTQLHNLSFVPDSALSDNLKCALSSVGQSLGHQKHQEMVARLQGYQTLNHRPNRDNWADSVTLFVSGVHNTAGVDMVSLEVSYLRVTITRDDMEKILKAEAAVRSLDSWGSMALRACSIDAYKDIADVDWIDDASNEDLLKSMDRQEADDVDLVNTQGTQVHVSPAVRGEIWISGHEKHGFDFETSLLEIAQLEELFKTGSMKEPEGWRVLAISR